MAAVAGPQTGPKRGRIPTDTIFMRRVYGATVPQGTRAALSIVLTREICRVQRPCRGPGRSEGLRGSGGYGRRRPSSPAGRGRVGYAPRSRPALGGGERSRAAPIFPLDARSAAGGSQRVPAPDAPPRSGPHPLSCLPDGRPTLAARQWYPLVRTSKDFLKDRPPQRRRQRFWRQRG